MPTQNNRQSSISAVTSLRPGPSTNRCSILGNAKICLFVLLRTKNQDWPWDLPSFLFNRYRRFLTRRLSGRGRKLTAHLHSVLKSRVNVIILSLHNTPSRSAWEQLGEVCIIWIQGQKKKGISISLYPITTNSRPSKCLL